MDNIILSIFFLLMSFLAVGQHPIQSDTLINKTLKVNETFELQFVDWPGVGQHWSLTENTDTNAIAVKQLRQEVMQGYGAKGGKWVTTYQYHCLKSGCYVLKYRYEGHAVEGKGKECLIMVEIK